MTNSADKGSAFREIPSWWERQAIKISTCNLIPKISLRNIMNGIQQKKGTEVIAGLEEWHTHQGGGVSGNNSVLKAKSVAIASGIHCRSSKCKDPEVGLLSHLQAVGLTWLLCCELKVNDRNKSRRLPGSDYRDLQVTVRTQCGGLSWEGSKQMLAGSAC